LVPCWLLPCCHVVTSCNIKNVLLIAVTCWTPGRHKLLETWSCCLLLC
jgi:hypothetical protein